MSAEKQQTQTKQHVSAIYGNGRNKEIKGGFRSNNNRLFFRQSVKITLILESINDHVG